MPSPSPDVLLSTVKAPPPWVFNQTGATKQILVGCALPFEGSQAVVGESAYEAAKMAIQQQAPKYVPGFNVNFTCVNSKCVDIPAYNAVYDLAEDNASGFPGTPAMLGSAGWLPAASVTCLQHLHRWCFVCLGLALLLLYLL